MNSGQTLTIEAIGDLKQDVEDGAKVIIVVKYGFIKLLSTTADLCEKVSNVDLECPVKKGPIKITKDVELPKEIPPVRLRSTLVMLERRLTMDQGKYTVYAEAVTKDKADGSKGDPITCLEATVQFTTG